MFEYTIRKSLKAKRLRITIHRDGSVVITVPRRGSELAARRFVETKKEWVAQKIVSMKERQDKLSLLPKGNFKEDRLRALKLSEEKLRHFNQHYGFSWKKITIKDLTTRWGSCSKLGNINFSYKIVHLPERLANYLVVHELCHLGELNHSLAFWKLVERTIPDYKMLRKELRAL